MTNKILRTLLYFGFLAPLKNEKEIIWKSEGHTITIEFPTNTPAYAIIRGCESLCRYESIFINGLRGYAQGWYKNGNRAWESYSVDGKLNGTYKEWDEDGKITQHKIYRNDDLEESIV
ncbi:MAG: hypothetical protein WC523_04500 [Patescibacteria group bacterium]